MHIRKTFQGAYVISQRVDGELVSQQYMGYTKKESMKMFAQKIKELKGN